MWEHNEAGRLLTIYSVGTTECVFCAGSMLRLPAEQLEAGVQRLIVQLSICPQCGWWSVYRIRQGEYAHTAGFAESHVGTIGSLRELDLTDISAPLNEVRAYLLARRDAMFTVHPRVFEDVVCSVFSDFGWNARVTAYSGDDGIDVILDGPENDTVGVQVKRYKTGHRIEAEQIRSLAGALVVNGMTKGIFVTTSSFRRGAKRTASQLTAIGYPIDLIDADRFLEALGIAQRQSFELDNKRYMSYVLSRGVHLGTGVEKPFVPGETLSERQIVVSTLVRDELISLYGDESSEGDDPPQT